MTPAQPATLEDTLAEAFRLLARGARDPGSPFHTPTLATAGLDGAPNLRTVVLRAFDPAARSLRIHTDRRSAKTAELARDARAMLHGYDPEAQVQLRLAGVATLHLDDAIADDAWASSRETTRMCYAAGHAPGVPLPAPPAAPQDADAGRPHFAAVTLRVDSLDWLLLARAGHRRARFDWNAAGTLSSTWIAP
ncbi:pyridoxamine 5'-phosphate oxidase family protein [Neoroseomonas soli]|uniref:Pyridoxamine 5'-phosphate oxidase n=1 Tax=Neoroseomonas soli TaxID=1081025 RepID=A0A9X9WRQ1_9PROT|nr:pyridoxamine 5'-phosphate oxidase family protein [Neoroseomonas soli]MBR0669830.1 pyridoxamine 5'-phosphate oxidase [Neoroseomonas soli]